MRTNWPESFSVEIISLASLVPGAKKPLVTHFFSAIPEAIYMVSDVALSAGEIHASLFFIPRLTFE